MIQSALEKTQKVLRPSRRSRKSRRVPRKLRRLCQGSREERRCQLLIFDNEYVDVVHLF